MRGLEDKLHVLVQAYLSSPQWVKSTVGRLYSVIPERVRYGSRYGSFAEQARIRDPSSVRQLQRQKLRETLDVATRFVPAYQSYRHRFEAAEDIEAFLRLLPLTDKRTLRRDRQAYVTTSERKQAALVMRTGGSLAVPLEFFVEKGHSRPREAAFMQAMRESLGDDGSGLTFALRGRNVRGLDPVAGRWVMVEPIKRLVMASTDHLKPEYMPLYAGSLRRWRPRRIEAFPSAIYPVAKWLHENPQDDAVSSVKFVYLFSENVYDYQRRLLEAVFRCPVINHYGASERVLFAHSQPNDPRMHFWPQYGYLELLDDRGAPVTAPGALAQIVGTSFDNSVMPFIRYRTDDYAVVADSADQPDRGFDVVERIEGRLQEFVVTDDGRLISVCTLGSAHFSEFGRIDDLQYFQESRGELVIRLVAGTKLTEDYCRELAGALREKLQNSCRVTVVQVPSIERTSSGKKIMIEQRLNISRYLDPPDQMPSG